MIGVVLGGRLGYILFYDFHTYIANPLQMLKVWEGGMSFHGGLLGVSPPCGGGRASTRCTSWTRWNSSRRWCRRASASGGWATSSTASCGES